ncbi:hypothetical protein AU476_40555 [Cupriavidus sp. UYMSc13B]|nr:hypothetical protein AU476_40555 [Cupriavidus sp. UYMSc13B]
MTVGIRRAEPVRRQPQLAARRLAKRQRDFMQVAVLRIAAAGKAETAQDGQHAAVLAEHVAAQGAQAGRAGQLAQPGDQAPPQSLPLPAVGNDHGKFPDLPGHHVFRTGDNG